MTRRQRADRQADAARRDATEAGLIRHVPQSDIDRSLVPGQDLPPGLVAWVQPVEFVLSKIRCAACEVQVGQVQRAGPNGPAELQWFGRWAILDAAGQAHTFADRCRCGHPVGPVRGQALTTAEGTIRL